MEHSFQMATASPEMWFFLLSLIPPLATTILNVSDHYRRVHHSLFLSSFISKMRGAVVIFHKVRGTFHSKKDTCLDSSRSGHL
jgi:hypothetical protein